MANRSVYTDGSRPEHLQDKYRIYALRFEDGSLVKVHVGRPMSFRTFCESYIFQHIELMNKSQGLLLKTNTIVGIEKIPNANKPDFEATMSGELLDISE